MRTICAWCGVLIVDEPGPVSHGICQKCQDRVLAEAGSESLQKARQQLAALHPQQDPRD